jgi:hypothetical protein
MKRYWDHEQLDWDHEQLDDRTRENQTLNSTSLGDLAHELCGCDVHVRGQLRIDGTSKVASLSTRAALSMICTSYWRP